MAYINTSHFNEGATETSNYSELALRDEGDVSYSTINYDRRTETVGLSAANLEPSNTVQRPNIHTRVIEHDGNEKSTDKLSVKCTCQKFNLKLIMVIIGMIVIAAASSTITALLLKQNFDDLLTDIREEMDLKKQDISLESAWSEWSPWGECSAPCNGGIQSRVRTCDISDKGLRVCVGTDVDITACNNNTCDSKCNTCEENTLSEWSEWSPWGECSASCNGGIKSRVRTCDESDKGLHACIGNTIEISACNTNTCVDGHWSSWNSWSTCSRSCNGGMTSRSRVCNNPAPSQFGTYCEGESIAYEVCNTDTCPEITWSAWSPWGECSLTCNGGIHTRTRTCDGVGSCSGNNVDFSGCNNNVCASVYSNNNTYSDGHWSPWSSWNACSRSCNGGMTSRSRVCNSNSPSQFEAYCQGESIAYDVCNTTTCPVPMVYFALRSPKPQLVSRKVTFNVVNTNRNVGGGYNTTTGIFTCPVAGLYHFYFSFMQSSTTVVYCYLMHNNTWLGQAETYSDGTGDAASTAAYVHLEVGDTIYVGSCVGWEHVYQGSEGVFTGALIHV